MLKSIAALLLILNSATVYAQFAEFSLDKKVHKFAEAKAGEQLMCTFEISNKGELPLILTTYDVACTCTKAEYSKEPITPGASTTVTVSFDTTGKIGWQYRSVTLMANTKKPIELEIRVKVVD
ncbi:MAG: DUF1573 domain-containing protein [Cryomorphaceae bacterium]|nr:DUF1573 domain-containing protein [Cryomorphaceae bacterium]